MSIFEKRSNIKNVFAALTLAMMMTGCAVPYNPSHSSGSKTGAPATEIKVDINNVTGSVDFTGTAPNISGRGIERDKDGVTVKMGGTYLFSGNLEEGRIKVDALLQDVTIILNGVSITNSYKDAIYIEAARSAILYVMDGTENTLISGTEEMYNEPLPVRPITDETAENGEDAEEAEEDIKSSIKAAIVAKCGLTVAGTGTLNLYGYINNGIQVRENLTIQDTTMNLTTRNDGIKSGTDMFIRSGTFNLRTKGDAIQSRANLEIANGSFDILTGDGSASVPKMINLDEGDPGYTEEVVALKNAKLSRPSQKGIKAVNSMNISGGTISIDSVDDSVHCDGDVTIGGCNLQVKAADDGIHSGALLTINDGQISVLDSYEGIEGRSVTINGGDVTVSATDDGISATTTDPEPDCELTVNGGNVLVDSEGDGLDSGKNVTINGGTVYVKGPSDGLDSPIDIGTEENGCLYTNGGTLIAVAYSDNVDWAYDTSLQQSLLYIFDDAFDAGNVITITDSTGQVVAEITLDKKTNNVTFSSSDLATGEIYTFTVGDYSGQLVADTISVRNK